MSFLDDRFSAIDQRLADVLRDARNHSQNMAVRGNEVAGALGKEILLHLVDCDSIHENCEIQDVRGSISREADLVLLNRFHPNFLVENRPRAFYVEGVIAVAEVKTSLQGKLVDCLEKARAFKRLTAALGRRDLESHNVKAEDWQRYLLRRPFFAFAFEHGGDLGKVKQDIEAWVDANRVPDNEQIDAVFILGEGVILNLGAGGGVIGIRDADGDLLRGFVKKSTRAISAELMLWLSTVCPRFTALDPIVLKYRSFDTEGYGA